MEHDATPIGLCQNQKSDSEQAHMLHRSASTATSLQRRLHKFERSATTDATNDAYAVQTPSPIFSKFW